MQTTATMTEQKLTERILNVLSEVHAYWGPGLHEEIYERSTCRELQMQGIAFQSQVEIPLIYKGSPIADAMRLDLMVEKKIVVELKAVKELKPVHESHLLTYMRLTGCRVGFVVNFNAPVLKKGLKRLFL